MTILIFYIFISFGVILPNPGLHDIMFLLSLQLIFVLVVLGESEPLKDILFIELMVHVPFDEHTVPEYGE